MDFGKDEYEIQLYGFPLREFILEHQILVKHKIDECVKMFTDKLIKRLQDAKASPETIAAISKCTESTTQNMYDSVKHTFIDFESLVEKYLVIPNNVVLPENFQHENTYTEIECEALQKEVDSMEKTFKENCYMLIALKAELQSYDFIESIIEKEDELAEKVEKTFDDFNESFGKIDGVIDRIKLE